MFPLIANADSNAAGVAVTNGGAATSFNGVYIDSIITSVAGWIDALVPLLIGLAVVAFFWGLVRYIWGGAEAKAASISMMVWGLIAIAIMVSIWGLVALLQDISNVKGGNGQIVRPELPGIEAGDDL